MAETIDKIEIIGFTYTVPGLTRDSSGARVGEAGAKLERASFAVRVHTDAGATGAYCPMWGGKPAQLAQVKMVAALLLGKSPDDRTALYERMKHATQQLGFLGVGALDCALWDLAGVRAGKPVIDLLGRYRTRLPTYVSTYHGSDTGTLTSPQAFAAFAVECRDRGFPGFKIHGWTNGDARREVQNLVGVRKAVGDDMALMIDPSCTLRTFADTLYVGRACDDADYFWYEDPMLNTSTSQHAAAKLRQMIRTPLLMGEHVRSIEAKADWIVSGSTDFVRADPDLDLGISGTIRIAHMAECFGVDVEIHGVGPAHRHCMGAVRNSNFYELALVGPQAPNAVPPVFACDYGEQLDDVDSDGCVNVPVEHAGLGVTYDWDFIEHNATGTQTFTK